MPVTSITLADGHSWAFRAAGPYALRLVETLASAMTSSPPHAPRHILHVSSGHPALSVEQRPLPPSPAGQIVRCAFAESTARIEFVRQLRELALIIAHRTQCSGGLLVHGALVAHDENAVILAGPPRVGKSTACRRLPPPWRVCSDDLTLIARDAEGRYWAHPWPTWSRFLDGDPPHGWNAQTAVRLRSILFLRQADEDRLETIGSGQAACLLVNACQQARWGLPAALPRSDHIAMRAQCFQTICALTEAVSYGILHISLEGEFWRYIS